MDSRTVKTARDAIFKTPMEHGVAMGYDRMAELLAALQAQGAKKEGEGQ